MQSIKLRTKRYQSKAAYSTTEGIVSFILNCISVVCLVLTLLTCMLFPKLRTQPGTYNMILSVFLIAAYLLLAFGVSQSNNDTGCGILGGIIHFCWVLVSFCMNVCSIHMFSFQIAWTTEIDYFCVFCTCAFEPMTK